MNSNPDPRTQPLTTTANTKRMSKTRKVVLIVSGIVIALLLVGVLGIALIVWPGRCPITFPTIRFAGSSAASRCRSTACSRN